MAKKMFEIKPQTLKTPEQAYSELLGDSSENQVVDLKISLIDEIKEQPFHIRQEVIERIADSMASDGQLEPILVVPNPEAKGRYLLLAGRHRTRAASLIGNKTVKAVIKNNLTPTEQRRILLSTNTDRANDYSPSELAFAYKEQMELMKAEGAKKTVSAIAAANGTNRKTVDRLIHLTNLDKSLLHRVDAGEITIGAGYELSFLPPEKQKKIGLELFNQGKVHIDNKLARKLRENPDNVKVLLSPEIETKQDKQSKQPFSHTIPTEQIFSQEEIKNLGYLLFAYCKDIFSEIIIGFATPKELNEYIKKVWKHRSVSCGEFDIKGTPNGLAIHLRKDLLLPHIAYRLTNKDIDLICRSYLRKFVKKEDIVKIIKETET